MTRVVREATRHRRQFLAIATGRKVVTNAPSVTQAVAVGESADNLHQTVVDLREATQARIVVAMTVAGSAGTLMFGQYDEGAENFLNLNPTEIGLFIDSLNPIVKDSGWFDIKAVARVDNVPLRLATDGGDGVADPSFSAFLYIR